MKTQKDLARLLLMPAYEAIGGPCPDWKGKVRLLSHGLLKTGVETAVVKHVKECAACRLFLLKCIESHKQFLAAYLRKDVRVADRLSSGKDALIKVFPASSKTRSTRPSAYDNQENLSAIKEAKKDVRNGKE